MDLANMKKVDFTMDLQGQDQNWAIWDIETPGFSTPAEDTVFEKFMPSQHGVRGRLLLRADPVA